MSGDARSALQKQLETAWKLTTFHLQGLGTAECLWRPGTKGLHVHRRADGTWQADWPDRETYDVGPPSVAWLTWHIGFWWTMALDHSFGDGTASREDIHWPGDADEVRAWIESLQLRWTTAVAVLTDAELMSSERTRWPFKDRPFVEVMGWVNLELTKNAAEIGYARFLFADRHAG